MNQCSISGNCKDHLSGSLWVLTAVKLSGSSQSVLRRSVSRRCIPRPAVQETRRSPVSPCMMDRFGKTQSGLAFGKTAEIVRHGKTHTALAFPQGFPNEKPGRAMRPSSGNYACAMLSI